MKLKKNSIVILPVAVIIAIVSVVICFAVVCHTAREEKYYDFIIKYSTLNEIEPELVFAVIKAESNYNAKAVSNKGAQGLMQIMPKTAEFIAEKIGYRKKIELTTPQENIMLGCAYLAYLREKFTFECETLCAYNAGEGVVAKWLLSKSYSLDGEKLDYIPYSQTRNYVDNVLSYKQKYKQYLIKKGYYESKKDKRQFISIFDRLSDSVRYSRFIVYNGGGEFSDGNIYFFSRNEQSRANVFAVFSTSNLHYFACLVNERDKSKINVFA